MLRKPIQSVQESPLDFVMALGWLAFDSLLVHQVVKLLSGEVSNVHRLQNFAMDVEKLHLRRFSGNFFKLRVFEQTLEIFRQELLDLRKFVQTSSSAGLGHSSMHQCVLWIFAVSHIFLPTDSQKADCHQGRCVKQPRPHSEKKCKLAISSGTIDRDRSRYLAEFCQRTASSLEPVFLPRQ